MSFLTFECIVKKCILICYSLDLFLGIDTHFEFQLIRVYVKKKKSSHSELQYFSTKATQLSKFKLETSDQEYLLSIYTLPPPN